MKAASRAPGSCCGDASAGSDSGGPIQPVMSHEASPPPTPVSAHRSPVRHPSIASRLPGRQRGGEDKSEFEPHRSQAVGYVGQSKSVGGFPNRKRNVDGGVEGCCSATSLMREVLITWLLIAFSRCRRSGQYCFFVTSIQIVTIQASVSSHWPLQIRNELRVEGECKWEPGWTLGQT